MCASGSKSLAASSEVRGRWLQVQTEQVLPPATRVVLNDLSLHLILLICRTGVPVPNSLGSSEDPVHAKPLGTLPVTEQAYSVIISHHYSLTSQHLQELL